MFFCCSLGLKYWHRILRVQEFPLFLFEAFSMHLLLEIMQKVIIVFCRIISYIVKHLYAVLNTHELPSYSDVFVFLKYSFAYTV